MTLKYDPHTATFVEGEGSQAAGNTNQPNLVTPASAPVPMAPPMALEQALSMCKYQPNLPPHGNSAWLITADNNIAAQVVETLNTRFADLLGDNLVQAQKSNILVQDALLTKLEHSHAADLILSEQATLIVKSVKAKNDWDERNEKRRRQFEHKEEEQVKPRPVEAKEGESSLRSAIAKGEFVIEFHSDTVTISIPDKNEIAKYGQTLSDMGFNLKLTSDSRVDYDEHDPKITLQGDNVVARTLENFPVFEGKRENDLINLAKQQEQGQDKVPSM